MASKNDASKIAKSDAAKSETKLVANPGGDARRRRYLIRLAIGALLLLGFAYPATIDSQRAIESMYNRPADWVPDSVPAKADFNRFSKQFDVTDALLIAWPGSDLDSPSVDAVTTMLRGLTDPDGVGGEFANRDEQLHRLVRDAVWVPDFYGDARQTCGVRYPLRWVRSGTETVATLTAAPASMSRDAAIRRLTGTLIGPDHRQTCLVVALEPSADRARRMLLPILRESLSRLTGIDPRQIAIVGGPFDGSEIDRAAVNTVAKFAPLASIIAAILCLICLRSIALTTVIVATAVIGQGMVLALVIYAGYEMNAVLIVLPPLIFVLTVSAGIHLSNYYLDISREFPHQSRSMSASVAMRAGTVPCVLATATTVVGLSSLLLVRLEPVRVFGAVASIGVSATLAMLILVLPGAMVLTRPRRSRPSDQSDAPERRASWGYKFVRRRLARPWPTIAAFAVLCGLAAIGLPRLQSSVNVSHMFTRDSQLHRSYSWFEEHVGATATGDIVVTFPPTADIDSLARLGEMISVQSAVNGVDGVGGTMSAANFLPAVPRSRSLSGSARRGAIAGLIDNPESSIGQLGFVTRDETGDYWRITVRMSQIGDANFRPRIDRILAAAQDAASKLTDAPQVQLTGHIVIVEESQAILLNDLFYSFLAAFGIIAVVMIIMLRSIIGGLLAMLPNLFPMILLFGVMGWIAAPLDIGSVMSASVALGIAVDDTVHLLSRYGSRRGRGLGKIRASHGALSQCGWAMFQTTLVCGLSLMAYYFSDFVPTSRFALLMFALLTSALGGVLFLLPAMMASPLGKYLAHTVGADPAATVYHDVPKKKVLDVRRV